MDREVIPWNELVKLTRGESFEIERVRIKRSHVALEGRFELPALVQLSDEDQVFIAAFLRSHGSIKEMERLFGISYPTVKARLNRIASQLPFVETLSASDPDEAQADPHAHRKAVLDRLARGEINAAEAAKLLRGRSAP